MVLDKELVCKNMTAIIGGKMNSAIIYNVQKFSVHDGPGIRTTVFFKGCPLKCLWCHNPESQEIKKQILFDSDKCVLCGICSKICPQNAMTIEKNKLMTDFDKCNYCGQCEVYCVKGARQVAGKEYTIDEILKEVIKDKVFYEQSNGGVTVSGGEPLLQINFVEELFKRLKDKNIHTAVDTCGAVGFESIRRIAPYTDIFLYDIKLMDDEKHREYTGMSNKLILDNLKKLSQIHNNINLRMPIIEGVNGDERHIEKTIDFIKELKINKVNLLPYHDIARHKYKKLGILYEDAKMSKPSDEKMQHFKELFEKEGYEVKIGG